jgi:LacI family transcriptional regulator
MDKSDFSLFMIHLNPEPADRPDELQTSMHDSSAPSEERPTLKTIAYLTGLGVTTVSRALKDGPEIGEATKQRVRLIAQQVGYRPNRAGVRLRTGKTNVISLVLNTQDEGSGFLSALVYGISEVLSATSYHLVVTPYSLSDPMEPVRYIVETKSADGIIISRTQADDPRVRYLQEHNFPFATHGRTTIETPHAYCDYDNAEFANAAVHELVKRGRRKIGLLGPPLMLLYAHHTSQGFREAISKAGPGISSFDLSAANTDMPMQAIHDFARQLGRASDRPDGFVVSSALSALALVSGLEEAGLSPSDYDIVSKEGTMALEWFRKNIITINEDFHDAGRHLAKSVIEIIDGADPSKLQHLAQPVM